jgi:hypothetical protein
MRINENVKERNEDKRMVIGRRRKGMGRNVRWKIAR